MKSFRFYLPCLWAGLASAFAVWFLIGPMGATFGFCLDSGPIFMFCLAAAVAGAVIARLHQRLRYLEEAAMFLRQRLDIVEKQSDQL